MFDRLLEPESQAGSASSGDAVDHPLGAGNAGFCVHRHGQAGLDQATERPIDQGPADFEDPSYLAVLLKMFGQGEAMTGSLGKKAQYS